MECALKRLLRFAAIRKSGSWLIVTVKKHALISKRLKKDAQLRRSQMDQMGDNLEAMQKNVQLVRQRKEKLNIRSNISGEIGLLDVELGQSIQAGQKIGVINDLSDFKVQAQVDEHYIDRVKTGLTATFDCRMWSTCSMSFSVTSML